MIKIFPEENNLVIISAECKYIYKTERHSLMSPTDIQETYESQGNPLLFVS